MRAVAPVKAVRLAADVERTGRTNSLGRAWLPSSIHAIEAGTARGAVLSRWLLAATNAESGRFAFAVRHTAPIFRTARMS